MRKFIETIQQWRKQMQEKEEERRRREIKRRFYLEVEDESIIIRCGECIIKRYTNTRATSLSELINEINGLIALNE